MEHTTIVVSAAAERRRAAAVHRALCRLRHGASISWMQGKDVLIVYDDLSKHAVAYRALSLLLQPSPGPRGLSRRRVLSALPPAGAGRQAGDGARAAAP